MKNLTKSRVRKLLTGLLLLILSGCASTNSGNEKKITEVVRLEEVKDCADLGVVSGSSTFSGLNVALQNVGLDEAKKEALDNARLKGATHIYWTETNKSINGSSVRAKIFKCQEVLNENAAQTPRTQSEVVSLSESSNSSGKTPSVTGRNLAVMTFEAQGVEASVSSIMTDIFTSQIQSSRKYRVLERTRMNSILKEQGFQQSGACNESECAVEIGRLLSVDVMVIGSIGKLGNSWIINARLINVASGEIVSNYSKQVVCAIEGLGPIAKDIANELIK